MSFQAVSHVMYFKVRERNGGMITDKMVSKELKVMELQVHKLYILPV